MGAEHINETFCQVYYAKYFTKTVEIIYKIHFVRGCRKRSFLIAKNTDRLVKSTRKVIFARKWS